MKRCPTCQRTYEEDSQKFCANDGTPLVADETPAFDPEATVMSIPRPLLEEQPPADAIPTPPEQQPTQYFNPSPEPPARPEPDVHQSYPPPSPPSPAPGASPAWPPAQPQQQQPPPQPYYPQQGMAGGSPQAPPWQGGQQPPQQPGWTPGAQPPGQNWGGSGGGYYPQQQPPPGQYAPYKAGAAAPAKTPIINIITLIIGIISFLALALIFGMSLRFIPRDRDATQIAFYCSGIGGILAVVLGIVGLITSRGRKKVMAILGILLSIPGILFFIYVIAEYGLP